MKDRIKRIMESQHMTQQVFAQFIKIAPATLSGIFNGRTNPSLNIVESIKQSLPSISTDWLIFGQGPMYMDVDKHDVRLWDSPYCPTRCQRTNSKRSGCYRYTQ